MKKTGSWAAKYGNKLKPSIRGMRFQSDLTDDVESTEPCELDAAEVVAFDGQARTITLRFDLMPCAAIGEKWLVRPTVGRSRG